MNQHISKKRLTAFVDNDVSESESALITDHLNVCDTCAAFVEEMRSLFSGLSELAPAPEEPDLLDNTVQLLRVMQQQSRSAKNGFNLQRLKDSYRIIAAGAIAAGLAVGILFGTVASQGLLDSNNDTLYSSVVLQENDSTINDTYVAMIVNDSRDDL